MNLPKAWSTRTVSFKMTKSQMSQVWVGLVDEKCSCDQVNSDVHNLCNESERVQHCHKNKTPTRDKKIQCIRMLSILRLTSETNELIECRFVCRALTGRAMKIVYNSFVDFIF